MLLVKKADVQLRDNDGLNALAHAARGKQIDAAQILIAAGVDIKTTIAALEGMPDSDPGAGTTREGAIFLKPVSAGQGAGTKQ